MKTLFLDVDGVLNNYQLCRSWTKNLYPLDDSKILMLKDIVDKTGCTIVLSSTWRLSRQPRSHLMREFHKVGIPHVFDVTDNLGSERHFEIEKFIEDNKITGKVAILDDDTEASSNFPNCKYFRTMFSTGLTSEIKEAIISYFNYEEKQ